MIPTDPTPPPEHETWPRYAIWTVLIAGMSAAASGLATWAVDELRARYGKAKSGTKETPA